MNATTIVLLLAIALAFAGCTSKTNENTKSGNAPTTGGGSEVDGTTTAVGNANSTNTTNSTNSTPPNGTLPN